VNNVFIVASAIVFWPVKLANLISSAITILFDANWGRNVMKQSIHKYSCAHYYAHKNCVRSGPVSSKCTKDATKYWLIRSYCVTIIESVT
jgi:hypothetical protein